MTRRPVVRAFVTLAISISCGGAPPAAPTPALEAPASTPPSAADEASAPELPSSDAFGVLRVENLRALREANGPFAQEVVATHDGLTRSLVPVALQGTSREDRPIDVILVADTSLMGPPSFEWLLSAEVGSADEVVARARRAGEPISQEADGRFEIGAPEAPQCTLFSGTAEESRLLCGSDGDLRADHVEVAGVLARRPLVAGDVVGELWGPALRKAFGTRLAAFRVLGGRMLRDWVHLEYPTLAPVIGPNLSSLVEEAVGWIDDLDHVRFRVARSTTETDLEVSVRFSGETTYVAQSVRAAALAAGPPPALFWQMPADAHTTFFSTPRDVARLEQLRLDITRRVNTSLELTEPSLRELLVESVVPKQSFAYASGGASTQLQSGSHLYGDPSAVLSAELLRSEVTTRFGWQIFAVNEPIDRYLAYMDKSWDAYKRGPLRDLVYDTFAGLCDGLPAITRRQVVGSKLPAGTVAFEMTVPSAMLEKCLSRHAKVAPSKPVSALLVAVPDGDKTWIGLGLEPQDLEARILGAMGRDGARGGLADVVGLAPLRGERLIFGGHLTPLGLAMARSNLTSFQRGAYSGHNDVQAAKQLTNGGLVPMPYAVTADATTGLELRARLRVPHDALR